MDGAAPAGDGAGPAQAARLTFTALASARPLCYLSAMVDAPTLPDGSPAVMVGELAAALGSSRSGVLRAEKAGRIAAAPARWNGKRVWPRGLAAEIVSRAGKPVPASWEVSPAKAA